MEVGQRSAGGLQIVDGIAFLVCMYVLDVDTPKHVSDNSCQDQQLKYDNSFALPYLSVRNLPLNVVNNLRRDS